MCEAEPDYGNCLDGKIAGSIGRGKRCSLGADCQAGRGVLEIGAGINRSRPAAYSRAYRKERIGRVGSGRRLLRPLDELPVGIIELAPVDCYLPRRTSRPGLAPVCSPCSKTGMPATKVAS